MPAAPLRAEASWRAAPSPGSAGVPGYPRVIRVPTKHPELGGRGTSETQTCGSPERGRAGAAWPARSSSARRGRGAAPSAHGRVRPFPQRGPGTPRPWPYMVGDTDAGGLPEWHLQCSCAAPGQIPISQCFRGTAVTNGSICSRGKVKQRDRRRMIVLSIMFPIADG